MKKVYVPGSKSITNRALLLAALSDKPVTLTNVLDSDDSRFMQAALKQLGVQIEAEGWYLLTGVDRMQERPQADLMDALKSLGVSIKCENNEGFLPAVFNSQGDLKSRVELSGKVSSQFLSGLMLVAPAMPKGLEIQITDSIPSRPYVEMTVEMLKLWGVKIEVSADFLNFKIKPGFNAPTNYAIPSDMSSASYPLMWSVLRGAPISIENFGTKTLQGDEQFVEVIKATGAKVTRNGEKLIVEPDFDLKPMGDWDWETMPDVSMTGMVLAAFCPGTSVFTGLESLRVKECDRIFAMEQLKQLAVDMTVEGDTVTITGAPSIKVLGGDVSINSYDDHRIAMCFGVAKAAIDIGADPYQESLIQITEPECVGKTWPGFWIELAKWENQMRPVSALIVTKPEAKEAKYLIVKKPRKHNAWQFPQGGVDKGETGRQAAIRELNEECGSTLSVKIKGERPVGEYSYFFPSGFDRHRPGLLGAHVSFYKADFIDGQVEVDGEEIIDHAWVTKSEFEDYFEDKYLHTVQVFLN